MCRILGREKKKDGCCLSILYVLTHRVQIDLTCYGVWHHPSLLTNLWANPDKHSTGSNMDCQSYREGSWFRPAILTDKGEFQTDHRERLDEITGGSYSVYLNGCEPSRFPAHNPEH